MRKRLYVCKQMRGSQMREAQITNDGSTNQKMCWYHHQSLVNIVPPPLDRSFSLLFLVCLTRLLPRIISLALPRQPPPLHALIVPEGRRRRRRRRRRRTRRRKKRRRRRRRKRRRRRRRRRRRKRRRRKRRRRRRRRR